jgi:hypothetical protein
MQLPRVAASLFVYDEMVCVQAGRQRVDQEGKCRKKSVRSILVLDCGQTFKTVS